MDKSTRIIDNLHKDVLNLLVTLYVWDSVLYHIENYIQCFCSQLPETRRVH